MALVGKDLFVANSDAVLRFPYTAGETRITAPGVRVLELPAAPINRHWTKNLMGSPDGKRLYVSVGSNSNVAERGMAVEAGRAAIWEVDIQSGAHRVFASGLRNPVGLAWEPPRGVADVARVLKRFFALIRKRELAVADFVSLLRCEFRH